MKQVLRLGLIALIAVALAVIYVYRSGRGRGPSFDRQAAESDSASPPIPVDIPDGGEIFAIDVDVVTGLDFNLPGRKLSARRPNDPKARFSIRISDEQGHELETCQGGRAFAEALSGLSSIRVTRPLDPSEGTKLLAAHRGDVAELLFLDATEVEAQPYRMLALGGPAPRVIVVDARLFYESQLAVEPLRRLRAGCTALVRD